MLVTTSVPARRLTGAVVAGLGTIVFLGWLTDIDVLKSVNPSWVPMMVNASLAFIALGVALLIDDDRRITILAIAVATVGGLTTLEYIFGLDFGIDDPLGLAAPGAGRMAPNTALAFTAVGLAIGWPKRSSWKTHVMASGSSLVLSLGSIPLLGYIAGYRDVTGWGSLSRMAVHTAIGFTIVGATLFVEAWRAEGAARRKSLWLPLVLVSGILMLFVLIGFASVAGTSSLSEDGSVSAMVIFLGAITATAITTAVTHAREAAESRFEIGAVRAALEQSLDGYARLDGQGHFIEADTAFRATFRLRLDGHPHWASTVAEDERPHLADAVAVAPATGRAETTIRVVDEDGASRVLRVVIVMHPAGASHGQYWALHDVTHTEVAAEELQRSNDELERFASVVSHDLKEPLRMVSGYTQLLQARYNDQLDDTAREFIEFAVSGANRMRQLIDDLLDYAQAGMGDKKRETVPLAQSVNAARELLHAQITDSGASIEVAQLSAIDGSPAQLTQVFTNLIGNAIKYAGDDPPRISISATSMDRAWKIEVRDFGMGVPAHQRERIFQPFERLHRRDQIEGTGVGLSICQRIIEQHGGRIWVENPTSGPGSVFVFTLFDQHATEAQPGGRLLRAVSQ